MRKVSTIILIAGVFLLNAAFGYDNEPDGFRGIKWGTKIDTLKGMMIVRDEPAINGTDVYVRANEEMKMEGAELETVEYYFWMGRFAGAVLSFSNENFEAIRKAAFSKYGDGTQPYDTQERYWWRGPKSNIMLDLDADAFNGSLVGYFIIGSTKITKEQSQYEHQPASTPKPKVKKRAAKPKTNNEKAEPPAPTPEAKPKTPWGYGP